MVERNLIIEDNLIKDKFYYRKSFVLFLNMFLKLVNIFYFDFLFG